jgi:hypothetical protein
MKRAIVARFLRVVVVAALTLPMGPLAMADGPTVVMTPADQTVAVGTMGSVSVGVTGGVVIINSVVWAQVSGPAVSLTQTGATAYFSAALNLPPGQTQQIVLQATVNGQVSDGQPFPTYTPVVLTGTANVNIVNHNPVATASPATQTVVLTQTIPTAAVQVDAHDQDNNPLTVTWEQVSGPATLFLPAPHATSQTLMSFSVAGQYVLRAHVVDGFGGETYSNNVSIEVLAQPVLPFTVVLANVQTANNTVVNHSFSLPVNITRATINHQPTVATPVRSVSTSANTSVDVPSGAVDLDSADNLTTEIFAAPLNGTLTPQSGRTFRYTPSTGFTGTDSFVLLTRDNTNAASGNVDGMALEVVEVHVGSSANLPPVYTPLTLTTPFRTSTSFAAVYSDPENGALSTQLIGPLYGRVSGAVPNLTYTPDNLFSGQDTALIRIIDNAGNDVFAPVQITVGDPDVTSASVYVGNPASSGVKLGDLPNGYGVQTLTVDTTNKTNFPNDGSYSLFAKVQDKAGVTASASTVVIVDNTPPNCSWINPIADKALKGSIAVTVSASDGLSGVRAVSFVDPVDTHQSPFVPISATQNWLYSAYDTREKEGSTQLQAVVYDVAGNVNTCDQSVFTDNVAPTGAIAFDPEAVAYNALSLMRGMNTVSATGADAGGIASTVLSLDGAPVASASAASASSPLSTSGYADGAHALSAIFTDKLGNTGTATRQITIDNTAPAVNIVSPANGAVVTTSLTSISAAVVEANGVVERKVLIDGAAVPFSENNNAWTLSSPVLSVGLHTLTVTAKDTVGNVGQDTRSFVIAAADNNPGQPGGVLTVTPVGLSNGSVLTGNSVNTLTMLVGGGTGSATVTAQIDGGATINARAGAGNTFAFDVNTTGMTNGSHTIAFNVTDGAGVTAAATITVVVDNVAPAVTFGSPADGGGAVSGTVSVQASATDTGTSGIGSISIYVDGQFVDTTSNGSNSSTLGIGYLLDTTTLSNGNHSVEIRTTDHAGNVTSEIHTIAVANSQSAPGAGVAPVISVISPADNLAESGAFYGKISVANNPTTVGVRIDGAAPIVLDSAGDDVYQALINVTQYLEGFHTLEYVAANAAGDASQTIRLYFDHTPPVVAIVKPVSGATLALVQTLVAQASDGAGRALESVTFKLNGTTTLASFPGNTDPNNAAYSYQWDTQSIADGDYTLTVIAKDQAGLSTQATAPFHVNNTNIPTSVATVSFRYSNADAKLQSGTFFKGPITLVSAQINNALLDAANVNGAALQVFIDKDGGTHQQLTPAVRVNGNSVEFYGTIPANARVSCVLSVLDGDGKVIRHTDSIISAMSKDTGGNVLASTDGQLQLRVPGGALPEDALVEVTQLPSNAPELQGAQVPNEQFNQTTVYGPFNVAATGRGGVLQGADGAPLRLHTAATLSYERPAQESPLDGQRVDRAEHFNSSRHTWDSIDDHGASLAGVTGLPQSRTISAAVTTLGIYRISAIPQPGDGVTELIAYPSPLRAGSQTATIAYLMGDNADADVVIYDVLGNLVRQFHFNGGAPGGQLVNEVPWDGRNGAGDVVANGAYIIQVTSTGHRARTKIGVAK